MDLQIIVLTVALAFLAESMVEYVFGMIADQIPAVHPYRWLLAYVAMAVGVLMAYSYSIDMLTLITGEAATNLGVILTGLGIGRGANYIHDFVGKYIPSASNR